MLPRGIYFPLRVAPYGCTFFSFKSSPLKKELSRRRNRHIRSTEGLLMQMPTHYG